MDERALEIIAEHESKKVKKIIEEFESLKPKPFRGFFVSVVILFSIFLYDFFTASSFFQKDVYFLMLAVVIASGAIEAESSRTNKRVDLLVKLIRSGSIKAENS